jgi:hypothetical protein
MNQIPSHAPTTEREAYECPRVLEDLPLESMSLACNSKFDTSCEDGGLGEPS